MSSGSDKAVLKHTAKKSRQIPALAHDIELRNRKILMDQQNKVTIQLLFLASCYNSSGKHAVVHLACLLKMYLCSKLLTIRQTLKP